MPQTRGRPNLKDSPSHKQRAHVALPRGQTIPLKQREISLRADGTIGLVGNLGRRQSIPSRHIRMSGATLPAALMAASTALLMAIGLLSRPAQDAGPAWSAPHRFASAPIIARHRLQLPDAPKQSSCAANPPDTAAKPGFVYQLSGSADAHIPGAMMTSLSHHLIYQVFYYRVQNTAFPGHKRPFLPTPKWAKTTSFLIHDGRFCGNITTFSCARVQKESFHSEDETVGSRPLSDPRHSCTSGQ